MIIEIYFNISMLLYIKNMEVRVCAHVADVFGVVLSDVPVFKFRRLAV